MSAPSVLYPTGQPISVPVYQVSSQGVPLGGAGLSAPNAAFPTGTPIAVPIYLSDASGNPYTQNLVFNIIDYGAISGDNNTNKVINTTAVTTAMAAAAVNGGIVFFPPGVWRTNSIDFSTAINVGFLGCGMGISTWKLADATNADLLHAFEANINLAGTAGTGSNNAVKNFFFKDLTLDGNKAGQSSGTSYVLRYYGYWDRLENIEVINGFSGGIQRDYIGSTSAYGTIPKREPNWINVFATDNNGIGVEIGGPTDAIWVGGDVANSSSHNIHICPNAGGALISDVHTWFSGIVYGKVSWLVEGSASMINCEAEGSDSVQVAMLSQQVQWRGGRIFGTAHNGAGIQIGQFSLPTLNGSTSSTPFTLAIPPNTVALACYLQFIITGAGASGNLALSGTDYSGNVISENVAASGNGTFTSTLAYATCTVTVTGLAGFSIFTNGLPLPYPSSLTQSGGFTTAVQAKDYVLDTYIHDITSANASLWFCNDTGGVIKGHIKQASGSYFTGTPSLLSGIDVNCTGIASKGSVVRIYNPSTSVNAIATGGTITTNGVGIARLNPAGAVTGIIMQSGIIGGQICKVTNKSAFLVTFAASGTSHVADGVSDVIAAQAGGLYVWDSTDSLWYRC